LGESFFRDHMKKISFLLVGLVFLGISCKDDRELPVVPHISFNRVEFTERTDPSSPDILTLYIDFRDGDGDLGLSAETIEPPYNEANYFYDDAGKLLTIRSRNDPRYAYLPPYESPYDCINYTNPAQTLYFPAAVVDNTFNIVDTIVTGGGTFYGVEDMIYFETNEDHYNITVDFLLQNPDGSFSEFDWREQFCNQSFDGRFPPLADDQQVLEGTLIYHMKSLGFVNLFSIRVMKLRITIKDRALHQSNTIETDPFTLR
jgi:hypothetical protein